MYRVNSCKEFIKKGCTMVKKNDSNLTEAVYEKIVDMIFKKEIKCGEKIQEEKIAKILKVSRTPVRESLRKLSTEGIVNAYPRRFSEVITLNDQYIKNLGFTRLFIDSLAIQLAMQHGSNEEFFQLRELADQSYEAARIGDLFGSIKKDCDFHLMLCKIGKNVILKKLQSELFLKVRLVRTFRNEGIKENFKMVEDHYDIVEKLFERDTEQAVRCIQKHIVQFYDINTSNIRNIIFDLDYSFADRNIVLK